MLNLCYTNQAKVLRLTLQNYVILFDLGRDDSVQSNLQKSSKG